MEDNGRCIGLYLIVFYASDRIDCYLYKCKKKKKEFAAIFVHENFTISF